MFRKLDASHIAATGERLRKRIEERFPQSSLSRVAAELDAVTHEASALARTIAAPEHKLRLLVGVGIALSLAVLLSLGSQALGLQVSARDWSDLLQGLEALVNDLVFVGIAIYFLLSLEPRQKRRRVLKALNTLRSLVHIVDMHQLTKDPERLLGPRTASSPERHMTALELTRYLDYSSEMLAIIGKVAALYVQDFDDPITLDAASAVQDLAVNHSRAIWQKLMILDRSLPPESPVSESALLQHQ